MSGAVMDAAPEATLFEAAGSTLEDIVLGAWEDLAARDSTECPVCHALMERTGCETCGSSLS